MDNDQVKGYLTRLDAEWSALSKRASEAYRNWQVDALMRKATGQPITPFLIDYPTWRADLLAWQAFYVQKMVSNWLDAGDFNAAREWHERLRTWEDKYGPIAKDIVRNPIPDRASTAAEQTSDTVTSASTGLGIGIGGLALILGLGYLIVKRR